MANDEWAKRFLRLAAYSKDTREPRGPEHMAKMKAARGPYSDPGTLTSPAPSGGPSNVQRESPVDGSVGERGLRLAASVRPQAAGELALPECSPGAAQGGDPRLAERRPGAARCCGSRTSEWVCAIARIINNGGTTANRRHIKCTVG